MSIVFKFGGSTLKSYDDLINLVNIVIKEQQKKPILVLSAFYNVTNELILIANNAKIGDESYILRLKDLISFHRNIIANNLNNNNKFVNIIEFEINKLESIAEIIFRDRFLSASLLDSIMSFGEKLSCLIFCLFLSEHLNCEYINAEEIVKTDSNFGFANVNLEISSALIYKKINNILLTNTVPVVTGFIGSNNKEETTTLGRNGSDYSAALIASSLNSHSLNLFKDVDGVYTTDPKTIKTAKKLNKLSYKEMEQLCNFGNKVVHLKTIKPVVEKKIPIIVRSIFDIHKEGTTISETTDLEFKYDITGIGFVSNVVIVSIQSKSIHAYGNSFFGRLFDTLQEANIETMLITKSSLDSDICFAVKETDFEKVHILLNINFKDEILQNLIAIHILQKQAIIAIVGDKMLSSTNVAGKAFNVLGENNINITTISSSAMEINILICIAEKDRMNTLELLHRKFFE